MKVASGEVGASHLALHLYTRHEGYVFHAFSHIFWVVFAKALTLHRVLVLEWYYS